MKKRVKLFGMLTAICTSICMMVIGVWAVASTVNLNLTAGLKYYPEGVYVELEGQVYRGKDELSLEPLTTNQRFTLEKTSNFDNLTGEPSGNFPVPTWEIGAIPFLPQEKFVEIRIKVENYSEFIISGTPIISFTNSSNQTIDISTITNLKVVENVSGIANITPGGTQSYSLLLEVTTSEVLDVNLSVAMNFEEDLAAKHYDYFNISGDYITGLKAEYASSVPEVLIIPAYNRDTGAALSIADSAFYDNTNLKNVVISDGLKRIDTFAFYGCTNLRSITIPESVTFSGVSSFNNCTNLIHEEGGIKYIINTTPSGINKYFLAYQMSDGEPFTTINSNCRYIGRFLFSYASIGESITIPASVIKIGDMAFEGHSNLKVTFEDPNGWKVLSSLDAEGIELSPIELSNSTTAATYLTSTYLSSNWQKS